MKFRKPVDNSNSMIMLGGWLFADLLLGLAMLFLTSGTSGTPPPTMTPTATPNQLATNIARNSLTATAQAFEVAVLNSTIVSNAAAAESTEAARATEAVRLSTM